MVMESRIEEKLTRWLTATLDHTINEPDDYWREVVEFHEDNGDPITQEEIYGTIEADFEDWVHNVNFTFSRMDDIISAYHHLEGRFQDQFMKLIIRMMLRELKELELIANE